jgi:hypothetical protein
VEQLSNWTKMLRGLGYAALAGALVVGAFWAGTRADLALGLSPSVVHAAEGDAAAGPVVADRAAEIDGQTVGEVLINAEVVIRMRTSAGGFTAPERAMIIAGRMHQWLSGPYSPYDLAVREGAYGGAELRAAGELIVDVNEGEAAPLGSTPMGLANAWKDNVMMALGVEPSEDVPGPATPVTGDDTSTAATGEQPAVVEDYDNKIVPILSLGGNTAIGGARVNGPESKVGDVVAVTQLEAKFKDFLEIDIYVPVKTSGGLDRVQQVGITALGDIEL